MITLTQNGGAILSRTCHPLEDGRLAIENGGLEPSESDPRHHLVPPPNGAEWNHEIIFLTSCVRGQLGGIMVA